MAARWKVENQMHFLRVSTSFKETALIKVTLVDSKFLDWNGSFLDFFLIKPDVIIFQHEPKLNK